MRAAPRHGFKPWTQTELSAGHRQKRRLRSIPSQPGWSLRQNQRQRARRGIRRGMAGPKRPRLIGAGILFNEEMEFDGWSNFCCHHFLYLVRRFPRDFCSSERARIYVLVLFRDLTRAERERPYGKANGLLMTAVSLGSDSHLAAISPRV
jgi:hypothetical protein